MRVFFILSYFIVLIFLIFLYFKIDPWPHYPLCRFGASLSGVSSLLINTPSAASRHLPQGGDNSADLFDNQWTRGIFTPWGELKGGLQMQTGTYTSSS